MPPNTQIKQRILAVDDSRVMRRAISKILNVDYDIVEAENGEDAWTHLLNDKLISLVFTDLSMPFLDGFALLDRIKTSNDPQLNSLPVIIITGKDDNDDTKKEALEKGASDFISKPFDSVQLQARAKAHLKFKQTTVKLTETSKKLANLTAVDETTGLGGQRYFCKVGEETIAYSSRHGMQFITVRMDIDGFNKLFLQYGRQVVDYVLHRVGRKLTDIVRQQDTIARIGVSKFALILKETSMDEAVLLIERIRKEIQSTTFKIAEDKRLKLTMSAGLYEPELGVTQSFKDIMRSTETYLEEALANGGNSIVSDSKNEAPKKIPVEDINLHELLNKINANEYDDILPKVDSILYHITPLLKFLAETERKKLQAVLRQISQK